MSSMKYPYRDLGVPFDRNFRNDLNANFDDIEHDIRMIGGEAAQQALEAAEEANTQAIYAQTSGDYAQDKGDYAAQQGDYAKTQGDYAKTQGDAANLAATNANDAANNANSAATNANNAATAANDAATNANTAADNANNATTNANTAADNANTQATNAQNAAQSANDAATNANNAADNANTQAAYAQIQGDYAKAQGDYAKQVGDENKTRWLTAVNTYADIATTYPNPQLGDTVQTIDDSKIYRWDGTQWVWTQQYNANAITDVQNKIGILFQNKVYIEKYGAVGDGVTDDTQAFINAITNEPDGTCIILTKKYLVNNVNSYVGNVTPKKNIKFMSSGAMATIKIKPNIKSTTNHGTFTGLIYEVRDYLEEIDTSAFGWKVKTIQLFTGKIFEYIEVPDKNTIPSVITRGVYIRGKNSRVEFEIASVDKNDPDGVGTARIYLFEGLNIQKKGNRLSRDGNSVLNENLQIKSSLGKDTWILDFGMNSIPAAFQSNRKITQVASGKVARISSVTTYTDRNGVVRNIVVVDSFSPSQLAEFYNQKTAPLNPNEDIKIESYSVESNTFASFNKWENICFENIIFDGSNYEVGLKLHNGNDYNIIYTHAVKNLNIRNCIFKNSIASGVHVSGASNVYSSYSDFPIGVNIENCFFENNGRNDIEIIHGSNIHIRNCVGDGTLDIEPNGDEKLDRISIQGCSFRGFTPYSPSHVSNSKVSVSNSFFIYVISQAGAVCKISNSYIHVLSPYNGNSLELFGCTVNRFDATLGQCVTTLNNCEVYDLPRVPVGSINVGTFNRLRMKSSIIDLSLVNDMQNNGYGFEFFDCVLISLTRNVTITRSYCQPSTFRNTEINNVTFHNGNYVGAYSFYNCQLKLKDKTSLKTIIVGFSNYYLQDCLIEGRIEASEGTATIVNCVLDGTSKPTLYAANGLVINGLKSTLPQGIDWQWVRCCTAPAKLKFNNVCVSKNIPATLGIINGYEYVSVNNVAEGCTVLYMDDLTKHASVLYNNNGSLALKHINYA